MVAVQRPIRAYIGQKLLLRRGNELLILLDPEGNGDVPGGRLNDDVLSDLTVAGLRSELDREVVEEIGEKVRYELDFTPIGTTIYIKPDGVPTLLVWYEGEYMSGDIELSDEHSSMKWVDVTTYVVSSDRWNSSVTEFLEEYMRKVVLETTVA